MVHALGGPADLVDHPGRHLAPAPIVRALAPGHAGTVAEIDTREVGLAVVELGGGRRAADDRVDHRVGLTGLAGIGDEVGAERPLCIVHAASEAGFEAAAVRIRDAYRLGDVAAPRPPILAHIGGVAS
jgi:thymidine phosphorylase